MTQQDLDRIEELEALLEMGEELEDEDREELKELRSERRAENKRNKALSAWNRAKEVYRVTFPNTDDDPCYALMRLCKRSLQLRMIPIYIFVKLGYNTCVRHDTIKFDAFRQCGRLWIQVVGNEKALTALTG